jgi:16S rRNA (cytidine1402-2'-O)-methyltransferase
VVKPGCLYVAATPIGNLQDISARLSETLGYADVIVCEDTRVSKKLCFHLNISKPLMALHDANEAVASKKVMEKLLSGDNVVLISDAGTPAVSDPGTKLVDLCHENGVQVSPIPGPSAVASAMSVSGFTDCGFTFIGFLPRSGASREKAFNHIQSSQQAIIFFESPHRIEKTLGDLKKYIDADRLVLISREISKLHEQIVRRKLTEWLQNLPTLKGEFTVVVEPIKPPSKDDLIKSKYFFYKNSAAVEEDQIYKLLAHEFGGSPKRIRYKLADMIKS